MINIYNEAESLFTYTQSIRQDIHRFPELGFKEFRTAALVAGELKQAGFEVHTGIGRTGVTGFLDGKNKEPSVLLRFDMDALPINEENDIPYRSTHEGIMHACGHDGHIAAGLTIAKLLRKYQHLLNSTIQFVFQPAEEGLGGAKEMINDGVFLRGKPRLCLAFHLWNNRPTGWFGLVSGPVMASSDTFLIEIKGKGGHGAIPNQTIDPVIAAAQLITATQSIVSRNISPLDSAVISFGQVQSGDTYNVIPDKAIVRGTIRTFSPEVRAEVLNRLKSMCDGFSLTYNCPINLVTKRTTLPVINNEELTDLICREIKETIEEPVIDMDCRTMVSEDFSYFLAEVPGCYLLVGSRSNESGVCNNHHNPKFNFDETALTNAAAVLSATVFKINQAE